jgi:hypothetical protein
VPNAGEYIQHHIRMQVILPVKVKQTSIVDFGPSQSGPLIYLVLSVIGYCRRSRGHPVPGRFQAAVEIISDGREPGWRIQRRRQPWSFRRWS